jgi:hypothetical protein
MYNELLHVGIWFKQIFYQVCLASWNVLFFIETTVSHERENDLYQFRIFSFAEMGESESKLGLESHFVKDSDSKIEWRWLESFIQKKFHLLLQKIRIYTMKFSLINTCHPNRTYCIRTTFSTDLFMLSWTINCAYYWIYILSQSVLFRFISVVSTRT